MSVEPLKTAEKTDISIDDIVLSDIALPINDVFEKTFNRLAHIKYLLELNDQTDTFEYHATEHLRLSGIYWTLMALDLIGALHLMPREKVIKFVLSCYDSKIGGFSGYPMHDVHLLHTLSGLQVLILLDALHEVDIDAIEKYIISLQKPDGSFVGDKYGEVDTRFTYIAFNALALLNRLPRISPEDKMALKQETSPVTDLTNLTHISLNSSTSHEGKINLVNGVRYLLSCMNFDGGFGAQAGAESHSGQIFCSVGALAIVECEDVLINTHTLKWWLSARQLPCGGLNGRPEKLEDVCYSWWVLSGLSVLKGLHYIDQDALISFIKSAQDPDLGGISERPDHMTDAYHTYFGLAGMSLLGAPGLEPIDPILALPKRIAIKYAPHNHK